MLKNTKNKKTLYITLWVITGIMISFIIHGLIEIPILSLLTKDFEKYSLGIAWEGWLAIHLVLSVLLFLLGILAGLLIGLKAWDMIYVKGVRGKKYLLKM